jgi:protein MAK16
MCSRHTCPLANSTYATVIEHEDELYLYIKTAERAHLPRRMWEKVRLDASFPTALSQIDENLQWWDRRLVNRVKARMLRLKQYLLRKQKMMTEEDIEYVSVNKRQEYKLIRREAKAEQAARIELEIEKELKERLRKGTYDSIMNVDQQAFEKVIAEQEDIDELEAQMEREEAEDDDLDAFEMDSGDESEDESEDEDVDEDGPRGRFAQKAAATKQAGRRRERVMVEVEKEAPRRQVRNQDLEW